MSFPYGSWNFNSQTLFNWNTQVENSISKTVRNKFPPDKCLQVSETRDKKLRLDQTSVNVPICWKLFVFKVFRYARARLNDDSITLTMSHMLCIFFHVYSIHTQTRSMADAADAFSHHHHSACSHFARTQKRKSFQTTRVRCLNNFLLFSRQQLP